MAVTGCVCVCVCVTWHVHAGVDGSAGLDGGGGVSPVYLVRLGVLSFAVDHRQAQTEPLGKRLRPDAEDTSVTRATVQNIVDKVQLASVKVPDVGAPQWLYKEYTMCRYIKVIMEQVNFLVPV